LVKNRRLKSRDFVVHPFFQRSGFTAAVAMEELRRQQEEFEQRLRLAMDKRKQAA
jgi:hypothetical protein